MNYRKTISATVLYAVVSITFAAGTHDDKNKSNDHSSSMSSGEMSHWASPAHEATLKNPIKLSSESILAGAQLYQDHCACCHGESAEGNGFAVANLKPRPANLRAMAGTHPDGDFAYKIKTGRGSMPGWGNTLSNAEIWHLVNYIQLMDKESVANNEEREGHTHASGEGHDS